MYFVNMINLLLPAWVVAHMPLPPHYMHDGPENFMLKPLIFCSIAEELNCVCNCFPVEVCRISLPKSSSKSVSAGISSRGTIHNSLQKVTIQMSIRVHYLLARDRYGLHECLLGDVEQDCTVDYLGKRFGGLGTEFVLGKTCRGTETGLLLLLTVRRLQ